MQIVEYLTAPHFDSHSFPYLQIWGSQVEHFRVRHLVEHTLILCFKGNLLTLPENIRLGLLIFAGKGRRGRQSVAPLDAPLYTLLSNGRLGWKGLEGTNTSSTEASVMKEKKFYEIVARPTNGKSDVCVLPWIKWKTLLWGTVQGKAIFTKKN